MTLRVKREIVDPGDDEKARQLDVALSRDLRFGEAFRNVAAADIVYSRDEKWAYVAAVMVSTTTWTVVSRQQLKMQAAPRYEPTLLGWREAPLLLEALVRLPLEPDLILVNGTGTAHPRKFGVACHVGLALDHPTVGVASLWPSGCVRTRTTIQPRRGSKTALLHETSGERLGFEVYTQDNLEPIFVSPGNRVSVEEAVTYVFRCAPWHRIPEPLRAAQTAVHDFRHQQEER